MGLLPFTTIHPPSQLKLQFTDAWKWYNPVTGAVKIPVDVLKWFDAFGEDSDVLTLFHAITSPGKVALYPVWFPFLSAKIWKLVGLVTLPIESMRSL